LTGLKKIATAPGARRRDLIEVSEMLSIERQCELLGSARSSYYSKDKGEDDYNILI